MLERPMASPGPQSAWHTLEPGAALAALKTGEAGLAEAEARQRLVRFGPNRLPAAPRPALWQIILKQFRNPLIYLLLVATLVSLFLDEFVDAGFILAVLVVNAAIGAAQEWKAERSAEALQAMLRTFTTVLRDGQQRRLESVELVPGDVVLLESGSRVPADIRLLAAHGVEVDESLLTGESTPVEKSATARYPRETPLAERRNMLFAGTSVLRGRARGAVCGTGSATEVGAIAHMLAAGPRARPALIRRMERFTAAIGVVTVGVIAALAAAQLVQGVPLREIFFLAVALAVSAIPEGLPVAITVALAVATQRMARRNAIVRQLPAVETLGSCTVIASDKTGTLTLNELTITRLYLPEEGTVDSDAFLPAATVPGGDPERLARAQRRARALVETGMLCNEAIVEDGASPEPRYAGDTVDIAFLRLGQRFGLEPGALREAAPPMGAIPYEPQQRFAASFHRRQGQIVVHVKGAAETVLPMCGAIDRADLLRSADELAAEGFRVLAMARGAVPSLERALAPDGSGLGDLEFLGFVGLIDPLRPEAPEAVRRCVRAGIRVCMITGDHPETALAIARDLGLAERREEVVTGAELERLEAEPARFDRAVARARVFARVAPVQKLSIVRALQRSGHYVVVTGDGANDAPALGAAELGVAMGRGGTDVAREAAGIILADDNFASIVAGVEEGRIVYDNVRKVVYLLVSTGAAEIVLFLFALGFGLPFPLFPAQLLWLNLVTNGIQDVALAFEKGEADVLDRPPRPPRQRIFDPPMIAQVAVSGSAIGTLAALFFLHLLNAGMSEFEARNLLLLLLVLFENFHVLNCRSERRSIGRVPIRNNPMLILAVLGAQGVHIGAMYVPGLSDALGVAPVDARQWAIIAALAASIVIVMEAYKALARRRGLASARGGG